MNKNVYASALDSVLHHSDTIGQFCDLFGGPEPAFKWMHQKHTEQEIIAVLRKLGYEIPATIVGSARKKFLCKAGL